MLDFNKLVQQIGLVGSDSFVDTVALHESYENAQLAFDAAIECGADFLARLNENAPWVLWPVAVPLEPLSNISTIEERQPPVTVVGVDGSQIMPSHHEVHTCYLLNVGVALISYGTKLPPLLESFPRLYHRPEDLYPLVDRRRLHIDELYVSLERTLLELETLSRLAVEAQDRRLDVVALYDGSLIPWSVEKLPDSYQTSYLERMTSAFASLEGARIPLLGYLSHSRSCDIVNSLRVSICPYETAHCRQHCGHLNEEDFPCSRIWPLTDRQLLASRLKPAHRSVAFLSGASISKLLAREQRICFTYLNVGEEVARVEFPRWVHDDNAMLDLALGTIISQCRKGMGYPIALSEAHHLAVIKGVDRDRFFELITKHMVELGVSRVKPSPKESKKRAGFV